MKTEERLTIYKTALEDYTYCLSHPKDKHDRVTNRGLCHYFAVNFQHDIENLPELREQEPEHKFLEDDIFEYWFKPGELRPRIECLKDAIKLCENGKF